MRQAALRAKQGRIDEALAMIDAAQPHDEDDQVQGVLTKAQILRDADRLDEAVATLEAANQAQPDTVEIKRSEEHTSELQSLMRISYAVFCLKNKNVR